MPSPISLVLFDMDDVLCAYDWEGRVRALATLSGQSFDALSHAIWGSGFEDAADRGEMSAAAYLDGFAERLGMPFTQAQWVANRRAAMTPWAEMLDLARSISRHAAIGILTNNGLSTAKTIDDLYPELRPIFGERIVVSAELGTHKPDPEVYRRALARLGFAPAETLFTDDKPENIDGAIAAGLQGHLHAGPAALKARLAQSGMILLA